VNVPGAWLTTLQSDPPDVVYSSVPSALIWDESVPWVTVVIDVGYSLSLTPADRA